MSHSELVVVRTFNDRFEAQLAQSALQAAEIESMVRSDDAGGLRPHMALLTGVELLVRSEDAQAARQILDTEPTE
jgi:Putative prokaryotic signal transducing protein